MPRLEKNKNKGLLRLLPAPDRFNSELVNDFITNLPAKTVKDPRYMMIVVDRLKRSFAIKDMTTMKTEEYANVFLELHFRYHGFLQHITSDRGSNRVGDLWKELCRLTGANQRLFTAFYP